MTARSAQRTLQLLARVARVRELQARQTLAGAMRREDEQRDRVAESQARLATAHRRVVGLLCEARLDLARLPLMQEVAVYAKGVCSEAAEALERCTRERAEQNRAVAAKARYRERIEEHCHDAARATAVARDAVQQEQAVEAWIQRERQGGQP